MMQTNWNWILPCLTLLVVLSIPSNSVAQQVRNPRVEMFGGYAMMRVDTKRLTTQVNNVMGWGFSVTNNIYRGFGLTVDSGGFYRKIETSTSHTNASAYSLMAGPTINFHTKKVTPFIHVLAGVGLLTGRETSFTSSDHFSEQAFVGALGGGLDIPIARYAAIRVLEADYFPVHHTTGGNFNNIRWRSGVTFAFGGN